MTAPLLLVAHGSRDPRSAATVRRLAAVVGERAPGLVVRVAFLDLSEPSVPDALAELHGQGHRSVIVVPLLLGSAYHARVDLPALIAEAHERCPGLAVTVSDVLGPDPVLQSLAALRAAEQLDADETAGVVLTGVGSSDAKANAAVAGIAAAWRGQGRFAHVTHAFATCRPSVESAVARLRTAGASRIVLAPWFLAPGLLLDQAAGEARRVADDVRVAAPLGAHPSVAEVVLARYTSPVPVAAAA